LIWVNESREVVVAVVVATDPTDKVATTSKDKPSAQ
jgi:hypothetical protein